MFESLSFFQQFTTSTRAWLLAQLGERQVISGTSVLQEGQPCDSLFVVALGLVGVQVEATGAMSLVELGPGELVGDGTLGDASAASATVKALETTLLLAIPRAAVRDEVARDPQFAVEWYRAVAVTQERHRRTEVETLAAQLRARQTLGEQTEAIWKPLLATIVEFKTRLRELDQLAIKQGPFTAEVRATTCERLQQFVRYLNEQIGDATGLPAHVRNEIGARVAVEILPYLLLTNAAERFYSKPRGYAGDFLTIEMIYENQPNGYNRLGPLVDHWFLETASSKAVRNRRRLLAREIRRTCEASGDGLANICSLASGPAAEVFDVLAMPDLGPKIRATLVDVDAEAIAFVRNKATTLGHESRIRLVEGNLVNLTVGRQKIPDLEAQDLVYSIGLIDYFNDKWVVKLIDYTASLLRPRGRVILGNFHPTNSNKAFMDHVLDWRLIHRDEADMNRLFKQSKFGRDCTNIWFEEEGINLFCECVKP